MTDYKVLAQEYKDSAALIEQRITELQQQSRRAGATRKHKLRLRINRLQQMASEARATAIYLEDYAGDRTKKEHKYPCIAWESEGVG